MTLVGVRPMPQHHQDALLPPHVQEKAKKFKPGLMGINYTFTKNRGYAEQTEEYLDQKEIRPIRTDIKYFFKILAKAPRVFSTV